jgi:hypothetical protein
MPEYTSKVRVFPETLRSINSATFTGAYQVVGSPLGKPIRIIRFKNNSSVPVTISWDGVNDHIHLLAEESEEWNITANRSNVESNQSLFIAIGTQFYVKGAAGIGLVYIECIG